MIPLTILLKDFSYLGQGIFKRRSGDLAVFTHIYFRRSQSLYNNFHFHFLDELLAKQGHKDVSIRLCLDKDLIGYAPSFHDTMELEFHWGPKFTEDISKIKHGISRHECDDFQRVYYGISRSEFYWKKDEHEFTFEMEELRNEPCLFEKDEIYHCRYIHSIYDTNKKKFIHFDGAIRSYDLDHMTERLDKTFLEYGRKAAYTKLFWIDGSLALSDWQSLCVHYLQGNPLIYEYFGLGAERELQRLQPSEPGMRKQVLPFSIDKEDGIRLLLSYHVPDNLQEGRYIDCYDKIGNEQESLQCVEHLLMEVKNHCSG